MVKRRAVKKNSDKSENHVEDALPQSKRAKNRKSDESNDLEVEEILEMKNKKGNRQFKVKFAGQEDSDAIWKDETELDCQDLIDEYLKNHPESTDEVEEKEEEEEEEEGENTEENSSETGDLPKKETRPSRNKKSDNNSEYIADSIQGFKTLKGKRQFLVRWKGDPKKNDSWELEDNLTCEDLIEEYLESKKKPKPKNSTSEKEEEYEVDKIIDVKTKKNGQREFLIRWKGYTAKDDSWEPEKHLNCSTLMKEFLEKEEKNSPAKSNKRGAATSKTTPQRKTRGRR